MSLLLADINMSPFNSAGPVDDRMNFVYTWIWYGSLILGILVSVLLLVSFFRFRRRDGDEEPEQVHGNSRLEITWTAIPFAILFMLFIVTATNMAYINNVQTDADPNTGAQPMTVAVEGQQFAWAGTYTPGSSTCPRCSHNVSATDALVIPTGTPVNIALTSKDVNHSLYLPNLGGQMNALPGQPNHMWIEATNPGIWYGQCTELCGYGHHSMIMVVIAVTPAQFAACMGANNGIIFDPATNNFSLTMRSTGQPATDQAKTADATACTPAGQTISWRVH